MTTESTTIPSVPTVSGERADLLETLNKHRFFLRFTARDLTDAQANERTTASALCVGGLIKHVAKVEENWTSFILDGAAAFGPEVDWDNIDPENLDPDGTWADGFRLVEGETLADVLKQYEEVGERTDEVVRTLPDINVSHPLPKAPWFEPGASWSARRAFLHIIAETSQHAGHADIIRESLDGSKTMG